MYKICSKTSTPFSCSQNNLSSKLIAIARLLRHRFSKTSEESSRKMGLGVATTCYSKPQFQNIAENCAMMTYFGENTEFIEDSPENHMLPSDSTKTVSILNYRPPKFQSYEIIINLDLYKFEHHTKGKIRTKF